MKNVILVLFFIAMQLYCTPFYQIRRITSLNSIPPTNYQASVGEIFDTLTYAPISVFPEINQMKTIMLNFHFIYDNEGYNNVPIDLTYEFVNDVIRNMNSRIQENGKMHLPLGNTIDVLPGYFQAELHRQPDGSPAVYHHYDDENYWSLSFGKNRNNYSRKTYEKYKINEDSILNIFIQSYPKDSLIAKSSRLKSNGISFKNHIKLIGVYEPVFDDEGNQIDSKTLNYWDVSRLLQHEIGHTYGLSHAWLRSDGCEDTPPNPNCWNRTRNGSVCDSLWSNNLMDYNTHQIAMTPCQIAKIQLNINKESSKVKKFIKKDWCEIDPHQPSIFIDKNIVINGEKDFDKNIVVEKGATLVLRNRFSMPVNSSIFIKAGATLILDGARIHNSCGGYWSGIKIEELINEKGNLILLNESSLENISQFP